MYLGLTILSGYKYHYPTKFVSIEIQDPDINKLNLEFRLLTQLLVY